MFLLFRISNFSHALPSLSFDRLCALRIHLRDLVMECFEFFYDWCDEGEVDSSWALSRLSKVTGLPFYLCLFDIFSVR